MRVYFELTFQANCRTFRAEIFKGARNYEGKPEIWLICH